MSVMTDPTSPVRRWIRRPVWAALNSLARPTAAWRVLPDYLIIGAQRAGTTSLQGALMAHPGIKSPRLMKGVHYFDTAYDRDLDWYRSHFHTLAWQSFRERSGSRHIVTGEASPYYLFHPSAPDRIRTALPDARLIVLLRDPVERTISHFKHETRLGHEVLPLEAALESEPERLAGEEERIRNDPSYASFAHQHHSYVARSLYADQLRRVYRAFPRDQVLVLQSEPFFEEPHLWLPRVLDFIGADPWAPDVYPHLNATSDGTIGASVREALRLRFARPNAELFDLLGTELAWPR